MRIYLKNDSRNNQYESNHPKQKKEPQSPAIPLISLVLLIWAFHTKCKTNRKLLPDYVQSVHVKVEFRNVACAIALALYTHAVSGVGGDRTLVQTKNQQAFYMFIS